MVLLPLLRTEQTTDMWLLAIFNHPRDGFISDKDQVSVLFLRFARLAPVMKSSLQSLERAHFKNSSGLTKMSHQRKEPDFLASFR